MMMLMMMQAWLVMVSCFTCNGIIFGIINTFGILFVKLRTDLEAAGVEDAALKCCKHWFPFQLFCEKI